MNKFFKLLSTIKVDTVCFEIKPSMGVRAVALVITGVIAFQIAFAQDALLQQKPDRAYESAVDLFLHAEYGAAYRQFESFLNTASQVDSRRADAAYYQAFCSLNLYHTDGEKKIENFIATYPQHPRAATAYYELAGIYYREKNFPKAIEAFSKVDFRGLTNEQQATGRFRWGYSLFSQKNLKESLDQFNATKAQGGTYGPAASYYAGFIELSTGDYANALTDLKRAEGNASYATIVPVMIANVYYKQKQDTELLAYAEQALTREGLSSADQVSLLAAEANFRKLNYEKARTQYITYLDEHEENSDRGVLYRAGYSAFTTNDNDHAIEFLTKSASDTDSTGAFASYYLGLTYLKRNEKPLAATAFETAKKFDKDPRLAEESLFQSAKVNYDLGKADLAISEFEELLKRFPSSQHVQEVKELLSQAYVNANNYNKAIEYVESLPTRSTAVNRAYQKAAFLKGTELFNKEEYAQAVMYFEKSLQYPIDVTYSGEAAYWCAETYSLGRKYEQAVPLYEQSLNILANRPDLIKGVRYGLGYAHYNLQAYDKALISFREFVSKSTSTDANYADGTIRLADCYYVAKNYPEALSGYRKAIQLGSVDADYAHLQCGIILTVQRKYSEAAREFEGVSKSTSRFSDDATFQLAQLYFEQSNYTAAVSHYSQLIAASKSSRLLPYAHTRRAAAYFNLKNYDATANDYVAVLEKFPAHPVVQDLLLPLQESLNLAGRSGEFDAYLAQFKKANPDAKGIESVEFETAKNLYFNQNYVKAIDNLSRYVASYPESARISEARYYEAESYYRLKDMLKALEIYKQILPDNSFTMQSKVVARVAELEFKQGNYTQAVPAFARLAAMASNKKEQYTAWNGLIESYYLLAQYDSVDVYAKKILEQGNINASAQNKASLYMGKAAMGRGDYESAKDAFLTALNTARDEYGAESKYLLAEIFYLTSEYKQCYETLLSLNSDFASYEEWVGKSYLLISDYFLATGNSFQAKGTLKSLIDNFPRADIKDAAKVKLRAIEQEELKKKELQRADTTGNNK